MNATNPRIAANLGALGQVAAAATTDAALGTSSFSAHGLGGSIGPAYASTPNFSQFGSFGTR